MQLNMDIRKEANELGQAILNAITLYGEGGDISNVLLTLQNDIYSIFTKNTNVKVWRENEDVKLPIYMNPGDACCDLYAHKVEYEGGKIIVHTGLHFELPEGYEMEIRPRSSLTKTYLYIPNSPGTVDEGYRGEVLVIFGRTNKYQFDNDIIKVGDRVAQLLVRRVEKINWVEVEKLEDLIPSERGFGGHGSTGK